MANVLDIAKYIIEKNGSMSAMKLQKLCYYAQAWSLVWDDKPLFREKIEAWINGPVIPRLYREHKGSYNVSKSLIPQADSNNLTDRQRDTIDRVVKFYNKYDSQQLSDLTHFEDPWAKARKGLSNSERSNVEISREHMAEYYSSL